MRRCKIMGMVIWLLLALPAAVGQAQNGYPPPQDAYINDYAGLLTPADAANSRALLASLKEQHGIEATVVTIETVAAYDSGDQTIEAFATGLFNTWGIGDATRNDGVLLLVAVAERKVRIEVGTGYGGSKNEAMQEVINEHILPSFRQGEMSRGIYLGVRAIVGQLTGEWPPEIDSTVTPPPGLFGSTYALLANLHPGYYVGGGALVAFGLYQLRRRRSRQPKPRCPQCQARMKAMEGTAGHQYLDEGQRLEQELDSMRHKVWLCPKCHHHTLESRPRSYLIERCPQCKYKTVKVVTRTEKQPTYTKKGRQRVRKSCQYCQHVHEATRSIPPKKRTSQRKRHRSSASDSYIPPVDYSSSSSSYSDFGGGSSSGDGASGDF